ncbi:protein AGENET DOMAIN (AGD)-CONTAINING P1-like [Bidens hawaiensis]|uniref:protein AGENET DOMAIN (AGD)-CONTAINING P1-like n=1 Tax=Bidens hawaiensis TaxID=980011 RepID=UPI00404944CE
MAYERGDRVEVAKKGDGFKGSYYPANIISRITSNEYIIQYRTLVQDDNSGPLREILSTDVIRPQPREFNVTGFRLSKVVDAFDNDGWWVGKIIEKMESDEYLVHFEKLGKKTVFPFNMLRLHQEWKDGVWVYSDK